MRYIALLRGINVGGRSVPMAPLRELCASLGWTNLTTYIQSGNVVFDSEENQAKLYTALEGALSTVYPFPIPVMIRSAESWRRLAADRPFGDWTHPKQLSVTVFKVPVGDEQWQTLAPWRDAEDEIARIEDRLWVKTPGGYGETKFNNAFLEKKLGQSATTRNRATVDALLAML